MRLESVCLPVSTPAHELVDATGNLACFRARRARDEERFTGHDVSVVSELGSGAQSLVREDRVCVPARVAMR